MATERKTLRRDTDGGEAAPRPSRAMRAVDAIAEGHVPPTKEKHTAVVAPKREESSIPIPPRATVEHRSVAEIPDEGDAILSITPEGAGESVAVTLRITAPAEEFPNGRRVKLHLLAEQYAELSLRVGGITPEEAEEILAAGKLCMAIRRGLSLLQYGDRSARRLTFQLTAKGVDRETAEAATAYLSSKGYIREGDTARLRAEQGARKLWGPRRIAEDLRAHGFSADAVESALDQLSDVDFGENCAMVIRKKYRTVPDDRADRQKLIAALVRLGYDVDTARKAMREVGRE